MLASQPTVPVRFWAAAWTQLGLPIYHFFYFRSKDKSPFKKPFKRFISDIHLRRKGLNLWRQNVGCWNFSRSTTNIISATLATSSLAFPGWNTIWVGPSPRSLWLNKKATRVRQSTQLLLTQFETLLAPGGGIAQLQSDQIKINHA